jgi:D-beta-D-heptose 7-phosphate kinase/D-beta-D-heptose 1-phosphate adenosyltransferase
MMNTKQTLNELGRIRSLRALVVGDVMYDIYEFCSTKRSRPIASEKPGKRAYEALESIEVLGGAGNVAANLSSLGVRTCLVGLTGNDEKYFKIRELAERQKVEHFLVRDPSRPTITKARLYLDGEYLLRRDIEKTHKVDSGISATLVNEVLRLLPDMNVVVLSDYNKGVFTSDNAQQIIKECRLHSVPVVVDFKPSNRKAFAGADVIAPNDDEAAILIPGFSFGTLQSSCRRLHALLRCRNTVVTLGRNGICGCTDNSFLHIPGNDVKEIDAVGCGDTVRAGLAIGIALGLSLPQAMELGNDAAAVIVQKPATASLSLEELIRFIQTKKGTTRKHVSQRIAHPRRIRKR